MKTEYLLFYREVSRYGVHLDGETEESILVSEAKKDINILADYSNQRVRFIQKWTNFEVWKD